MENYIAPDRFWRLRFDRRRGLAYWTLVAVPPLAWSLARNVPLTVVGMPMIP
jgi:hypothetical protein